MVPNFFSRVVLALLALVCAFGCGSSDANPDPAAGDYLHYELHASTHELDAATLAAVADTGPMDGVVRFHGTPASLAALKSGEVLLAGASPTTPKGILRQVTNVSSDNGDLVVATRPAPIQIAFKSLHARITGKKNNLDGTLSTQSQHAVSEQVGNIAKLDWQIFDQDKNPATKDDQLYIHGEAGGAITFTVFIDLDWLEDVDKVAAEVACSLVFPICKPDLPNVKIGASIVAEATVTVDAEGPPRSRSIPGSRPFPVRATTCRRSPQDRSSYIRASISWSQSRALRPRASRPTRASRSTRTRPSRSA